MIQQSVGVIGVGRLGSDVALTLAERDLCDVVLYDKDVDRAHFLASDLSDTSFGHVYNSRITSVSRMEDLSRCDVILLAAGARMEPGVSTEEVFEKNEDLISEIADAFVGSSPLFVVASEPIDLMTAALRRRLRIPASRVLGIAGVVDSFRLRHALGSALEVGPDYIAGHLIGPSTSDAHIIWEFTSINGIAAREVAGQSVIAGVDKQFAQESEARLKRLTESFSRYAPAAAAFDLLRAIVKDDRRIITVTMEWTNILGISDVAMSVPAVIGRLGADRVELPTLDAGTVGKLQASAEHLKSILTKHVEQEA